MPANTRDHGAQGALALPGGLKDELCRLVFPAEMDEVEVEFPPGMTGLAHACTFRRRGNIVDFKVSRSDERAFHALFGFDNAAVGGRTDSVTGFVPASETREHVTLRIPRPALINQIL